MNTTQEINSIKSNIQYLESAKNLTTGIEDLLSLIEETNELQLRIELLKQSLYNQCSSCFEIYENNDLV